MTDCFATIFSKSLAQGKKICLDFEGGRVSSEGGVLLLHAADDRLQLSCDLAACLKDKRAPERVQHSLKSLMQTRLFLISLGYEDCNDADRLRHDPLLIAALGRLPKTGKGLPSQPTLSRFENGKILESGLQKKDLVRLSYVFLERFELHYEKQAPDVIVLEIDSTDDRTYGHQQLSFFNGHYDHECYLPYYVYATVNGDEEHFLGAVLRPGKSGTSTGALSILKRVVLRLKRKFRGVRILIRLDAGFARSEIYEFCEAAGIEYAIRFPQNNRLERESAHLWATARLQFQLTGKPVCEYAEVRYQAKGWPDRRRVVMKVEVDSEGMRYRFIVTNLQTSSREVFLFYNERGDFENRIKEMKCSVKAGRTSCSSFKANQFRLILYAASYVLLLELRRFLKKTPFAKAQVDTLRMNLLKLGTLVRESVRCVWVQFSSHFAFQDVFQKLFLHLRGSPA